MDYGVLPPEINSGRMYCGPGIGPMLTAAAAWDGLSSELYTVAAAYGSVISGLTLAWTGPAATAMAQAAAPYVTWLSITAAQAEQAAIQAKAAACAYETAFLMTVPPPVVAANRVLLMKLIATNFFGQNTPAIAATETEYAEMWAQDAAAMYSYASSSAAASVLTPFNQPPATTDPAGTARQAAAVAHASAKSAGQASEIMSHGPALMSAAPQALRRLAAPSLTTTTRQLLRALSSSTRGAHSAGKWSRNTVSSTNFLNKGMNKAKKRIEDRIEEKIRDRVLGLAPLGGAAGGSHGLLDLPGVRAAIKSVLGIGGEGATGLHRLGILNLPTLDLLSVKAALSDGIGHGLKLGALSAPQSWLTTATAGSVTEGLPATG